VAGTIALMQNIDTDLTFIPEASRAILLATTQYNPDGIPWNSSQDARDGMGALNTFNATELTRRPKVPFNNTPKVLGWTWNHIFPGDFDSSGYNTVHRYYVAGDNKPVRVVLSWRNPYTSSQNNALQNDFDLIVTDASTGSVVGASSSWDDNNEVAEFYASSGKTYLIRISRYSGNATTQFALAWWAHGNMALGATASASSTYCTSSPNQCYSPSRINDGNSSTALGGDYSWANNLGAALPQWVELNFGSPRTFGRVELYTSQSYPIQDYRLESWNGTGWVSVVSVQGNTQLRRTHTFAPITGSKLRVVGLKGPNTQVQYVRVNELEVYPN